MLPQIKKYEDQTPETEEPINSRSTELSSVLKKQQRRKRNSLN